MHFGELSSEAIQALCIEHAPRNPLLRHPLCRRVYLILFVLFTLVCLLPAWSLWYIPRQNRPRSSWTLQRCLRVRWSRRLCGLVARCEIDYLGRDLNSEMDPSRLTHSHPLTIPAAPPSFLLGHPAETLGVIRSSTWRPHFVHRSNPNASWGRWARSSSIEYGFAPVKAFWFTGPKTTTNQQAEPRKDDDPVMLHFHGGGYLCGTAAETDLTSSIPKALVEHSAVRHILSVDYRLAPTAPWPLPLLDAISAYRYLVHDLGVNERDIVIAGDSAGGHLALALTRWIRDEGSSVKLAIPRALVLMSPWTDIGFTHSWGEEGYKHNADSDTIDDTFGPFATSLLLRGLPAHMMHSSAYLSPASLLLRDDGVFDQFPPTFVVCGGAERLSTSIQVFYERLRRSRTANDSFLEMPDSVHDFMIFPWQAQEAAIVYEALDEWLRAVLAEDVDEAWREKIDERRRKRRASLKLEKSPVMRPQRRESGVIRMLGDLQGEGMSMIGVTPLDLDSSSYDRAKEWLTPFTSQAEQGDWDWGDSWHDDVGENDI